MSNEKRKALLHKATEELWNKKNLDFADQEPFAGIPATGRQIKVAGSSFGRFEGDKLAEVWDQVDVMAMMQQLGVIPAPETA